MAPRLFFLLFLLSEAASGPVVVRVGVGPEQYGQDVILPCRAGNVTIRAAEWTRSEPQPSVDILFWTDGHIRSPIKGRVQLVDDQLKTGDASLILKDVSREDDGTYECRVVTAGSRRKKRGIKTDPISRVELQVTDPGDQKGHNNDNNNGDTNDGTSTPQRVGLAAAAVVLLVSAAVGLFLVRKYKRQREKEPEPSAVAEAGDNLL